MKGCMLRLALYVPFLALFLILFSIRQPFPTLVINPEADGLALAPVAAFFFWFATLFLLDARQARINLETARESLGRRLRDGERAVVFGSVEPRGELLEAPFTGEACVGYLYIIQHNTGGKTGTVIDYEGYALTQIAIQCSQGTLAVLAPPDKELFYEIPFKMLTGDDAFSRATLYLQNTDFGAPRGTPGHANRRDTTDGPGSFRTDVNNNLNTDLRACILRQKVLLPGDTVHIAGIHSEAKQAIVPDPDTIMKPFHIVPGGEASLAGKLRGKLRGAVISTALGLSVVAVYFFAFLLRAN